MKFTKMSLVAALLIGSSAMALENTKITGDANLYYQTSDGGAKDFLESGSSAADMSVNLNLTTDVIKTDSIAISAGVGYTVLTTLGLEGTMVDGVWGSAHTVTGTPTDGSQSVDTIGWINEAWFAATAGKTTAKVGRMELDTPLVFTETWTIEKNTFESAVLINQDIPDTTLVGAYVGRGNGVQTAGAAGVVAQGATFSNYFTQGAYAVAAINNSVEGLALQAWFFDITSVGQATWFQGDLNMANVIAGLQYTQLTVNDASAIAGVIGYEVKDTVTAKIAYSDVPRNGRAGYNTAKSGDTAQTKLYTEAWWNYGNVTEKGAKSINLTVEGSFAGLDLGGYITNVDHDPVSNKNDLTEYTVTASKSIGFVDATFAYIHTDKKKTTILNGTEQAGSLDNTLQLYLTANF